MNELLTQDQIRAMGQAARPLSQLSIVAAVHDAGLQSQNMASFLQGRNDGLSLEKQILMLQMFGFKPDGTFTHELQSWVVKDSSKLQHMGVLLQYEKPTQVHIAPAYTQAKLPVFIGALVQFNSHERAVRLIVTLMPGDVNEAAFMSHLQDLFSSTREKPTMDAPLSVSEMAMRNVWRARSGPASTISGRAALAKRTSNLPFDQNLIGEASATVDQLKAALADVVKRLEKVLTHNATVAGKPVSSRDTALLQRVKRIIGQ